MSRPATFRQADIVRALKAAKAVGYEHPTVDILPDGRLRLLTAPNDEPKASDPYEDWKRKRGDRAA